MRGLAPFWIDPGDNTCQFPDVRLALDEPDGLLAVGGDLRPERLMAAYRRGIFPWYNDDQPILWWAPNPRAVLFPQHLKISRSLRKTLRRAPFRVSADTAFDAVIEACSQPREAGGQRQTGTWITEDMKQAYRRLHALGVAHSVECWRDDTLVGGLYGIALGRVFFGESMFSRCSDASKVAFVHLVRQLARWDFALIDCQVASPHLSSLGAETIPRDTFGALLERHAVPPDQPGRWRLAPPS